MRSFLDCSARDLLLQISKFMLEELIFRFSFRPKTSKWAPINKIYGNFSLGHFIKHEPLVSEECATYYNAYVCIDRYVSVIFSSLGGRGCGWLNILQQEFEGAYIPWGVIWGLYILRVTYFLCISLIEKCIILHFSILVICIFFF